VPPSLLALRISGLLYALPSVSALEPARACYCRCSLFPQEGCLLVRHGREGQDKDASDFGVCVAGPVRPLVAVPSYYKLAIVHVLVEYCRLKTSRLLSHGYSGTPGTQVANGLLTER
jgi:hypothetical protein